MQAALVMFKADGSRREFSLRDGATVVGRKNSCDLRIPLTSVSRQHCEFRVEGAGVKLRDLGSSNGTFRNGQRVQEVDLDAGDQVEVGPVQFTLTVDGQPAEVEPRRTVLEGTGTAAAGGVAAGSLPPSMEVADAASSQADVAAPELLDSALEDDDPTIDLGVGEAAGGPADDDEDDALASAIADMADDPDGSSGFSINFDDDDDDEMPDIELFDDDNDK